MCLNGLSCSQNAGKWHSESTKFQIFLGEQAPEPPYFSWCKSLMYNPRSTPKYGDISFHSGYVIINLEVIKTDQLREGNQVIIAESSNDDTCPVKIFKRYLSHLESSPVDPSHYVFRALSKTRSGHTLVAINKPISYSSVRDYFKSTFEDIVPDIALFSTH